MTRKSWFAATAAYLVLIPQAAAQSAPDAFVDIATIAPGIVVEMRYAGSENFVGRRIDGYEGARCLLTRPAAEALARVQTDLAARGAGVKIFDCYRPARAVDHFARWARDVVDAQRKREYYPDVDKRDLFRLGYIGKNSSHTRGSTVDLTLIDLASGRERDMGTPFDFMSERSGFAHPGNTGEARASRAMLRTAMEKQGFSAYAKEWWHFTLRNEPFPNTYFDFLVR
ncbi:MAG: M15 family metallopeptidase [Beijerinckiaceae bacterium]